MKLIYLIIGFIFTFALLYLTFINVDTAIDLDVSSNSIIPTNLGFIILCSGIIGGCIASAIGGYFYQFNRLKQQKQSRNIEKASIKAEESQDKVKALEAKIETLEEALKKALTK